MEGKEWRNAVAEARQRESRDRYTNGRSGYRGSRGLDALGGEIAKRRAERK